MPESDFLKQYQKKALLAPEKYGHDADELFARTMKDRPLYRGEPVSMPYQGMFFDKKQVNFFKKIVKRLVKIGRKVTQEYLNNPAYRALFHFDALTERLILEDPGYDEPVMVGRYDIFYQGGKDFQLCELNTDGSSAMNEDRLLGQILLQSELMQSMMTDWHIEQFELFHSLVRAFLKKYKRIRKKKAKTVAIVDFLNKGSIDEFHQFQIAFEKAGVRCLVADIRSMTYEKGKLCAVDNRNGRKYSIDLVYRRVVTSDFVRGVEECRPFLQAYLDHSFLMMGSFRSQVMHSKIIFSVLRNPMTEDVVNEKEWNWIQKHIPETHMISTLHDKMDLEGNRIDRIVKPLDSYASQGVVAGKSLSPEQWHDYVAGMPYDTMIGQQFIHSPSSDFLISENGQLLLSPFRTVLGIFLYGGKFAGLYMRIGQREVVSGAHDDSIAPSFFVKKKA